MKRGAALLAAVAAACGVVGMGPVFDQDIRREGSGEHRATLDQMELKPFPANAWSLLSDWSNGSALTTESYAGKPVLIVTWASWYKTSYGAVKQAEQLYNKYKGDGLIVVGVHHQNGYEKAADVAKAQGVTFPIAHDTSAKFRETLGVDQDPDFYVIDRAGNIRYADVATASVDDAVARVVKETPSEAAAVPAQVAQVAAAAKADALKPTTIKSPLKPGELLNVPFVKPDPSAYANAKWPEKNTESLSARDLQGQPVPTGDIMASGLADAVWISKKPNTEGRVIVIDFWATWCGPCKRAMPLLDATYREMKQDVTIIGVSDEDEGKVRSFIEASDHSYPQATDTSKKLSNAMQVRGIPHVMIVSTDGVIRWQGHPASPEFAKALKKVVDVDPGVQARRQAEAAYLKSQRG